jgi:hypothetical protein
VISGHVPQLRLTCYETMRKTIYIKPPLRKATDRMREKHIPPQARLSLQVATRQTNERLNLCPLLHLSVSYITYRSAR